MAKMTIAIGLGKSGDQDELSEYERGAKDMRDRCCDLADMYESGKKVGTKLSKLIDRLPLDEREAGPASNPSGAGMMDGEDGGEEY